MSGTFIWCPGSLVPETLPPEPQNAMTLNSWAFSAKPTVPFQKTFRVTLHGLQWFLNSDGTYDLTTSPTLNARGLELFYEAHGTWQEFAWNHPHLGALTVRFKSAVQIPAGLQNSGGLCGPLEITMVHHNPSYG